MAGQVVNFHVLFAISMVLRLVAVVLATQVCEPSSAAARVVAGELLLATRMRVERLRAVFARRGNLGELTEPRHIPFEPRATQPSAEPLSRRSA